MSQREEKTQEIKPKQRERDSKQEKKDKTSSTKSIRDRRYKRWDETPCFPCRDSSSWLVNPDWACIPLAVALTPKGLNQTGGYFKLRVESARSRLNPPLLRGNVSLSRQKRKLCVVTRVGGKGAVLRGFDAESEAEWAARRHQGDYLRHAGKTTTSHAVIHIRLHYVYILQLAKLCPSCKDI